jgi:hypothetical protein
MVNRILWALTAVLLVCGGASSLCSADAESQIEVDVLNVANAYFEALRNGDRETLLSLFSAKFRKRMEAQLSDPAYTQFLIDRYRSARLELGDSGARGGLRFVDITICLDDTECIKERLFLRESGNPADRPLSIARKVPVD